MGKNFRSPRWFWLAFALLNLNLMGVFAAEEFSFTVQAVQASERGKNDDKPQIAPVLAPLAPLLKSQGYGKYEDAGNSSATVKSGQATQVTVGSFTVTVVLLKHEGDGATIGVTLPKTGQTPMKLKAGSPNMTQIGEPAHPVLLIFQAK